MKCVCGFGKKNKKLGQRGTVWEMCGEASNGVTDKNNKRGQSGTTMWQEWGKGGWGDC